MIVTTRYIAAVVNQISKAMKVSETTLRACVVRSKTAITLTMAEGHWLRIRAALLCAAEDLAQAGSDQEAQYKHSYDLVRLGLEPWIGGHASTLA